MKYAVVEYTLSNLKAVKLYDNYEEAKQGLLEAWEDAMNTEFAKPCSFIDESGCYHEENSACMRYDNGALRLWRLRRTI